MSISCSGCRDFFFICHREDHSTTGKKTSNLISKIGLSSHNTRNRFAVQLTLGTPSELTSITATTNMSSKKVAVILGSGPGIGAATGSLFASNSFDVALLSRNAERLDQDVARVRKANSDVKVQAYPVDLGDHDALALALGKVETDLGPPEVVYYNAARVAPSKIGQTGPEFVLEDFKVSVQSRSMFLSR